MSTRAIHEATRQREDAMLAGLPEVDREAVRSLSGSMKASSLGGAALEGAMRDVKAFLRVRLGVGRPGDTAILREVPPEIRQKWERAFPYFKQHHSMLQHIYQQKGVESVPVYIGIPGNEDDLEAYAEEQRQKGYVELPALICQSGSHNAGIARRFGRILLKVNVPVKGIYGDARVSPLFVDPVEDEVFIVHQKPLRGVLVPSRLAASMEPERFPREKFPETW